LVDIYGAKMDASRRRMGINKSRVGMEALMYINYAGRPYRADEICQTSTSSQYPRISMLKTSLGLTYLWAAVKDL